jgi:flagellin-like hook-associated protein FlgL
MSITTPLSSHAATGGSEILGRSLDRLARSAPKLELADELNVSGKFDTQRQQAQSDLADVQNAVSAAQSADGLMSEAADLLTRMRDLVGRAGAENLQPSFKALQDQLRATIGTAASAGGHPSGAEVKSIVAQEANGAYALTLSSANAGDVIAAALQSVTAGRSGLADGLAKLNHRAAALQVEHANLNASIPNVQSEDDAASATRLAKYTLLAQPGVALSAQSAGRTPGSAFKLLEG